MSYLLLRMAHLRGSNYPKIPRGPRRIGSRLLDPRGMKNCNPRFPESPRNENCRGIGIPNLNNSEKVTGRHLHFQIRILEELMTISDTNHVSLSLLQYKMNRQILKDFFRNSQRILYRKKDNLTLIIAINLIILYLIIQECPDGLILRFMVKP